MKLKDIRTMIKNGIAKDITNYTDDEFKELYKEESGLEKVFSTLGVYGRNGILLQGNKTGQLYGITQRNQLVFNVR